jgi:hypothetical protein
MRRPLFITLTALLLGALAMPAAARTKFPTSTTFDYAYSKVTGGFYGELEGVPGCTIDRKVLVLKQRAGRDTRVGGDRSADTGDWFVPRGSPGHSKYYARVPAVHLGVGDSCGAYESEHVRFDR